MSSTPQAGPVRAAVYRRMSKGKDTPDWEERQLEDGVAIAERMGGTVAPEDVYTEESRRGESHPPPLAEPDLNLSAHPAPIAQPSGRAPSRQCANRRGDRRAISASHAIARRSRRLSRLYFRQAHRTRCRLSRRRK